MAGRSAVAKVTAAFRERLWPGTTVKWNQANGQACVLVQRDGAVVGLATIHASDAGIDQVMWMMNPEKLGATARGPAT